MSALRTWGVAPGLVLCSIACGQIEQPNVPQEALDLAIEKLGLDKAAILEQLANVTLFSGAGKSNDRLLRLLEDLNINFKTFETDNPAGLGLGFDYNLEKSLMKPADDSSMSFDLVAKGNYAFEPRANPDDFLQTSLRVRWFGTAALGSGETNREQAEKDAAALDTFALAFEKVAAKTAQYKTAQEVLEDADFLNVRQSLYDDYLYKLPPELIWDLSLQASLESDQTFSQRQETFGFLLGGRLVSWDPSSALSSFNMFDWPAATIRWLSGTDETFQANGEAWPTLVVGLDHVEAGNDDGRMAVSVDDNYLRFRIEAGMKTRLLDLDGEAAFLSLGWRQFEELDAPNSVKAARLDSYSHFQAGIHMTNGWSVTYSTGRLPFDASDDSLFAVGFVVNM